MLIIVGLTSLTACGAGPVSEVSPPRSMAEFREWTRAKAVDREREVHSFISECMSDAGFDYAVPSPENEPTGATFGETVADRIRASAQMETAEERDKQIEQLPVFPNEYYAALGQPGENGCAAEAEQAVGVEILPPEVVQILEAEFRDFGDDPQLAAALQTWASCLEAQGYSAEPSDEGDVSRLAEAEAVDLFLAAGYSVVDLDQGLRTVPSDRALDIADQLASVEDDLHSANEQCLDQSGAARIQDERLALALAAVPTEVFAPD